MRIKNTDLMMNIKEFIESCFENVNIPPKLNTLTVLN